ncbi:hypothetical protein PMAYCL1PPCAC_31014, partial [Pristionchus mayeri]
GQVKVGDRVETIVEDAPSVLVPSLIKRIRGRRVLLEYSKEDIENITHGRESNMWKDMNDDLIYPVGFALQIGAKIMANQTYRTHALAIADAVRDGRVKILFHAYMLSMHICSIWNVSSLQIADWKVDMVCEMFDSLDQCQNVLKAARIVKVFPGGFLQLCPEGADIITDSIIVHQRSPLLFPVGYAKDHSIPLHGPKGENDESLDWESFLRRRHYKVAPLHFFQEARESYVPYKVNMRLEAIDRNEKVLRPATVKAIKGRLLVIGFDGWDETKDHLYDYRSDQLFPCGWGEMVGHAMQAPAHSIISDSGEELLAEEV